MRFETGIHFARDLRYRPRSSSLDANVAWGRFHNAASICPVWLLSSSMACLPSITSPGCSCSISLQQCARDAQRLQCQHGLDLDCAVGAHGEPGAQLLLAFVGTEADDDDFRGLAGFPDSQRLFQRDFIKGVDAHLHAVGIDAAAVGSDPDADVVVDDAFYANQYFHGSSLMVNFA